ncbi:hypothetical protein [Arthrobacter bambusae]|uniref:Uncharacterized protein n=1 Tax=Arthrobacter bambusae TaxID=1338426 RepID=A0AAW8DDP3_9MICC|nr:hypothetical protein [Arthrobacter bambusae]MDP9904744.1 hypothetical protein [Arthrobacter bambusae]MDQ0129560.1 hypothetical protein [Arthrobacter bambusae]MDQ0180827.1 hypothetical protein [Arthrobacter bambusae]
MQQLTEDEFDARFTVVPDPVTGDDTRPFDQGLDKTSRHLWTIVDADGDLYALTGWHYVNRVGYLITEQTWEEEIEAKWFLCNSDEDENDEKDRS